MHDFDPWMVDGQGFWRLQIISSIETVCFGLRGLKKYMYDVLRIISNWISSFYFRINVKIIIKSIFFVIGE